VNLKKSITLALAGGILVASPILPSIAAEPGDVVAPKRPNFVTLVIDDMGFSDMGAFGGEVPTPHLDQLADAGTILTNFYAAATSSPSRAMLFSGKDSHQAGMGNMFGQLRDEQRGLPGYEGHLNLETVTFPQVLQDNGYHTMMVGKWHMGEEPELYANKRGFAETRALLLPGGDVQFLTDANGEYKSSFPTARDADGNFILPVTKDNPPLKAVRLGRTSIYNENGAELDVYNLPPNTYAADYFTDEAISMLDDMATNMTGTPFYLNMSYLSTHTPLQAPLDVVNKYIDTYAVGWDQIREQRFTRLQAMGYIPEGHTMPERPDHMKAWVDLSADVQAVETRRMAVYAAMIDKLDENVGKLIQHLKDIGEYENTVFFVYSDNGAETQAPLFKFPGPRQGYVRTAFPDTLPNFGYGQPDFSIADSGMDLDKLGSASSYLDQGEGWATVSSMPFNDYKVSTFEGGIHTAGFISYPKAKLGGFKYNCVHSVMDIAPTALDMAGATYPTEYQGKPNKPMEGVSMKGIFDGNLNCDPERMLGWEIDGTKGLRKGNWKLSQLGGFNSSEQMFLYNLAEDPFERNDLAASNPQQMMRMLEYYDAYAAKNGVLQVNSLRLPVLGTLGFTAQGDPTEEGASAIFTGGAFVNFPAFVMNLDQQVAVTDTVGINAQILVAKEHVGKPGKVFFYASFTPVGMDRPNIFFAMRNDGSFKVAELPNIANAPFFAESNALPIKVALPIFHGKLGLLGKIISTFGYELADGTRVFNQNDFTINIGDVDVVVATDPNNPNNPALITAANDS